jgi:putative Holliday junction resolvase
VSEQTSRVLGVDLGDARIGLAISDPLGLIAQPLETLDCVGPKKDVQRVAARARELEVGVIVVGLPLLMSGEDGTRSLAAREFAQQLERRVGETRVVLQDERLTTVQAERTMISDGVRRRRRKATVDPIAAALILQGYLDSRQGALS